MVTTKLATLENTVQAVLGSLLQHLTVALREITLVIAPHHYLQAMTLLRDDAKTRFDQLIDLCGVDYVEYSQDVEHPSCALLGGRFAVVTHLLSTQHNWRVRVRVFAPQDDQPILPSLVNLWASSNWYEREAFDLFGILFDGHPDLRRILTDYGFIGHPFRKDFPISGTVEMRYDPDQKRVIYQPVTIEPRELVPRVIREENYASK